VVAGPEIHARGFAEDEAVFDRIKPRIADALTEAASGGVGDTYQLQQVVRRVVGKWVNESYRRRPMIIPLVVEA
jgi:ribonuclease J